MAELRRKPAYAAPTSGSLYGLGFHVEAGLRGVKLSHDGSVDGSFAYLWRSSNNGVTFALVVNGTPVQAEDLLRLFALREEVLPRLLGQLMEWPATDMWSR